MEFISRTIKNFDWDFHFLVQCYALALSRRDNICLMQIIKNYAIIYYVFIVLNSIIHRLIVMKEQRGVFRIELRR